MRTFPGLTGRMAALMAFIESYTDAKGYSPSYDEMKGAIGVRSKNSIHRLVSNLQGRGYIVRHPRKARSIEVLRTSLPPILRVTVDLDEGGRFVRVRCPDARAVVLVNDGESTRPATETEVIAA